MKRLILALSFCLATALPLFAQDPLVVSQPSGARAAGAGPTTFSAAGLIAQGRSTTDTATQNTWNVTSVSIPANTLNATSDTLVVDFGLLNANNTNTHEHNVYFAPSTATCSGTSATVCDAGCQILPVVSNTTAFGFVNLRALITRTGSATEDFTRTLGGTNQAWTTGTCSVDTTVATKVVFGVRNTSAAAASLAQLTYWIWYAPHP